MNVWLKFINNFQPVCLEFIHIAQHAVNYGFIRIYLIFLFFLNLINWLAARAIKKGSSQDLIILHYNVDFGINYIDAAGKIYIIPLLGFLIALVNFSILLAVHKQSRFIAHALLAAAVLCNIFLSAGLAALYLINFR